MLSLQCKPWQATVLILPRFEAPKRNRCGKSQCRHRGDASGLLHSFVTGLVFDAALHLCVVSLCLHLRRLCVCIVLYTPGRARPSSCCSYFRLLPTNSGILVSGWRTDWQSLLSSSRCASESELWYRGSCTSGF
ncbi:hypothetical protein KC19_6G122300 [Ceratodon purpureus]|uniref:Uncharacterized protein n=1 Tax=Ceratodon purpureus TaxID=3225 RepID=A0A8T0HF20_CERPU|nr:hypothetical protein KC19_6G122300 [Ceratodon purpureus]